MYPMSWCWNIIYSSSPKRPIHVCPSYVILHSTHFKFKFKFFFSFLLFCLENFPKICMKNVIFCKNFPFLSKDFAKISRKKRVKFSNLKLSNFGQKLQFFRKFCQICTKNSIFLNEISKNFKKLQKIGFFAREFLIFFHFCFSRKPFLSKIDCLNIKKPQILSQTFCEQKCNSLGNCNFSAGEFATLSGLYSGQPLLQETVSASLKKVKSCLEINFLITLYF